VKKKAKELGKDTGADDVFTLEGKRARIEVWNNKNPVRHGQSIRVKLGECDGEDFQIDLEDRFHNIHRWQVSKKKPVAGVDCLPDLPLPVGQSQDPDVRWIYHWFQVHSSEGHRLGNMELCKEDFDGLGVGSDGQLIVQSARRAPKDVWKNPIDFRMDQNTWEVSMIVDEGEGKKAVERYGFKHRIKEVVNIHLSEQSRITAEDQHGRIPNSSIVIVQWEDIAEDKWLNAFIKNETMKLRCYNVGEQEETDVAGLDGLDGLDGGGTGSVRDIMPVAEG